ncbi:Acetyltransferase (isoleucine patch superfamily) [Lachnospiraceae bacterium G41]|nr:Acetyltransferase (isoleucine patch superfamily) [Lachnospiraceae bacterium G41]
MKLTKKLYFLPSKVINSINLFIHRVKKGKKITINGRIRIYGKGELIIQDGVRINSCYRMNPIGGNTFSSIYIKRNALVEIGEKTGLSNCALYAAQSIKIGRRVKLGGSVKIYDTDFHSIDWKERIDEKDFVAKTAPVTIGDDVFIGANSIILKGVSIGDRSVIGAGSVVTTSIPSDEIWAGVPAKFIRSLDFGEKE